MSISWEESTSALSATQEFTSDSVLNQKIKDVTAGLQGTVKNKFKLFPTDKDKELVADFLQACLRQENITVSTKKVYILGLNYLSKHFSYRKSFIDITAQDISNYLGSLQQDESKDPDRKWVNTRNTWASVILKFYKWVAYPNLSPENRKRLPKEKLPAVLNQLYFVAKRALEAR
jgi:Phage integrase, N-terminal SAM-like domain